MSKTETPATIAVDRKLLEQGENLESESPVFVETEKMIERLADISTATAQKAFEFFRKRDGAFGSQLDDWFKAESKILRPVAVEISESDRAVTVNAEVPGFKVNEIEVSVNGDQLILSGETHQKEDREHDNVVYSDWESKRFFRQLTLPASVSTENVTAGLKDGILTLSLPKMAAESTRIAVNAG